MPSPPAPLNNGALNTIEACSSIADASGNLLFYTDGITVWNATHTTMANGTGLFGHQSMTQGALIIKQPNSASLYYIFTISSTTGGGGTGLYYSKVDMSLAAGMGSVTVKNAVVHSGSISERLNATKHCNGTDYWVMIYAQSANNFMAYQVTTSGINTTAVISSVATATSWVGQMKFSPTGKKLGVAMYGTSVTELYDFNNSTGVISNPLSLVLSGNNYNYGCEFSPDGTKFYGGTGSGTPNYAVTQWNLSSGVNSTILSSSVAVGTFSAGGFGAMQLGPDGKIYVSRQTSSYSLSVINNPNVAGAGCNFSLMSQLISTLNITVSFTSGINLGLPNLVTYNLPISSFSAQLANSSSVLCNGANTGSAAITNVLNITSYSWTNGTNTYTTPTVNNLSAGSWSVTVTNSLACTSQSVFTISQPPAITVNIGSQQLYACASGSVTLNASASGGVGGFSYLFQGTTIGSTYNATHNTAGSYVYTVLATDNNTCTASNTISVTFFANPTLSISAPQSICPTFSANLIASGASSYTWFPNNIVSNAITVSPPGTSIYSVTGTGTTNCASTRTTQVFVFPVPTFTFNTYTITCANLGSATVAVSGGYGPYNYTWQPSNQTGSVAINLNPNTYTVTAYDIGTGCYKNSIVAFSSLIPLTGNLQKQNALPCNSVNTATAFFTSLSGGSGNQNYVWTNGATTLTTAAPNNLSAGNWSVTVTDALTACQINSVFTITQPPAGTLNITANTSTACVGINIVLTGTNSGGTPGYTYTWTAGPGTNTRSVSQSVGGNYVYTLNSRDANNCLSTKTIALSFVNNPTLTVANVSICPLQTGTLSVSGASTYTWNGSSPGSTFTSSPLSSTRYTVIGSALGCTSIATASVIVKPSPSPTMSSNSPICNGQTLLLSASGGTSYLWSGPLSFISSAQNPSINLAAPNNSGVYNLTVTAANACTAAASTTVVVNPTPTITMSGGPICLNSDLFLSANSFTGATYSWSGPNSFTSSLQNPTITTVSFPAAGNYSLLVTSAASCTNSSVVGVTVNPLPAITIAPSSTVICSGKSAALSASGGSTYFWNTGSLATIIIVSPAVTTSYTLLGTSALSCTGSAVQSISVNPLPTVSIVVSPTVYCAGGSSTLSAGGADTYTWNTNATSTNIVVSPVSTSSYNVRGTSAVTGCSNIAFATLSVNPLPLIVASTTKSIICAGLPATIVASGAGTYTWLPGNLTGATITPSPLINTTYTVSGTISASGCTNTAVRTISVNITPTVSMVSSTLSTCIGGSAVITPSGASTYTLNPGGVVGTSFIVTPTITTLYILLGTNSVNCINLLPSTINFTVHSLKAIQGVVTTTTSQNNGNVVLYGYKPVLGRWDSLRYSLVFVNNYNIPSVAPGVYVVKSFPFPTDIAQTYGLSSSSWKGASLINHTCLNNSNQNIVNLTLNNIVKGNASLSGKITQGPGYSQPGSPGAPIPNITVKAGVQPGALMYQHTRTNALGQYTLGNMMPNQAGEHYYILVDIPGLDTTTTYHRVIITGFENFTNLDFVVDSQRIRPTNFTVGVRELSMPGSNIKVFPNPANDQISIELELKKTEELSIELFDLSGRKIKTLISEPSLEKGKLTVLAKVEELKEGLYLLKVKIGVEEGVMKLLVER